MNILTLKTGKPRFGNGRSHLTEDRRLRAVSLGFQRPKHLEEGADPRPAGRTLGLGGWVEGQKRNGKAGRKEAEIRDVGGTEDVECRRHEHES